MYVCVYCHSLSPLCTFSISMMGDEDLLTQIRIGKSNLAKALITGNKKLVEMVGIYFSSFT